jgi:CBS domain-containing protein
MPSAFNFDASPFDCLDAEERRLVRNSVDIAYFRAGEAILEPGIEPGYLFVLIKGHVQQFDEEQQVITTYGPDDTFDGRALVAGRVTNRFVAQEEVLAYQLARKAVNELIARNATFGALLFSDLSNKLSALAQRRSQHEMQSLTMARVSETGVRPGVMVEAATSIIDVARVFQERKISSVLVRDDQATPPRLGIFTNTGLQRAILDGTPLDQLPVGQLATFTLVCMKPSDPVGEALALMLRHNVHRVVVRDDDGGVPGVLEALEVFSFLSNHSYLVGVQIAQARDLAGLAEAARQITKLIAILHRGGTRVGMIARLVSELNAKLFERTWHMVAPKELVANSCLFVMGSEGRGEQLLKTDQDNGLVLRDGYTPPADLEALCARFTQALIDFGYPPCPGGIMINNPAWRQPQSAFRETVRRWMLMPNADSLMALAIFLDAHAVCGDAALLEPLRDEVFSLAADSDAFKARFAAAITLFDEHSGWWNRLLTLGDNDTDRLDLKKAGIFPLVHGVRSLALDKRIRECGTTERVQALVAAGHMAPEIGSDVVQSLHFFMGLKLKAGLQDIELGRNVSGGVTPDQLNSLDRDLLKDTLGVVKRFKATLRLRYHLDALQ